MLRRALLRRLPILVGVISLLASHSAAAQEDAGDEWDGGFDQKGKRRSDFMVGLDFGYGAGTLSGYPNDLAKIGRPRYETDTGVGVASSLGLWLGGAIQDWFSVGIGVSSGGVVGNGYTGGISAFLLHLDVYPLYGFGGPLRDLGVSANTGAGSGAVLDPHDDTELLVNGGMMSFVQGGPFWEGLHFSHFASGPFLEYRYLWSPSAESHALVAGMRLSFYSRPLPRDRRAHDGQTQSAGRSGLHLW